MSNHNKNISKVCCDRYKKHLRAFNVSDHNYKRVKKVVVSDKNMCNSSKEECCSTGVLSCSVRNKTKKTTKSDITFTQNQPYQNEILDRCKKCGDTESNTYFSIKESNGVSHLYNLKPKNLREKKHLHQYYRNEKFYESSHSIYSTDQVRGPSLNTIIEHPEKSLSTDSVFKICSDKSESEVDFIDPDNIDNIKKLKDFRKKNYFECHSAKSRTTNGNVTALTNHKCRYRFYLNDRLFPVPVNSDYQDNIRCIECQLPLKMNDCQKSINGTIQAKVKLNDKIQDMMLMLPVKNSLIIQERRQSIKKEENDSLYFGIIKLNLYGDSIFNRNLPSDSLALRYQKGYEEFSGNRTYNYESLKQEDVIII